MKKILVMSDGNWLAHTSRPYEISKQLRNLGYEVIFASDGKYMQLPRESGFEVIPIISLDPEHALRCERSGRVNYYRYEFIKESVEADLSLLNRIKPDLVLTDFRLPTKISCELAKIPLAVILNAFWTDYSTVRMHSPESLPITRLVGQKTADYFIELIKYFIITYDNRPFNKLRKERGLKPTKNFWGSMSGDLNLMADIPQYSPTKTYRLISIISGRLYGNQNPEYPIGWKNLMETSQPFTLLWEVQVMGNILKKQLKYLKIRSFSAS